MADIKNLQERMEKAQEKVTKCEGTIVRHQKQLDKKIVALAKKGINLAGLNKDEIEKVQDGYRQTETSWEIYEVKGKMDDIKGATRKLSDAVQILDNWKEKLELETEKERFLDGNAPQVIKEFLEAWKVLAFDWHVNRLIEYKEFSKRLDKAEEQARIDVGIENSRMPSKSQREELEKKGLDWQSIRNRKASFAGVTVLKMATMREPERLVWLEKVLEEEKKAKMLDLINRINAVVGAIVDAKALKVSDAGNLNGIIIGETGKAKIETIGAGGYAIQCFHYRTLINEI